MKVLIAFLLCAFLISSCFVQAAGKPDPVKKMKQGLFKQGADISNIHIDWTKPVSLDFKREHTASGCKDDKGDAGTAYQAALNDIGSHKWTIVSDTGVFPHYYCSGDCVDYCYVIVYEDGTP